MLLGNAKRIFTGGPAGPAGATLASALQDVAASIKGVLTAPDLASARAALGLGNVANVAPLDLPVSTATAQAIAQAVANLVASSPAALDTLKELADALNDDPNFAATMAAQLGLKAPAARVIAAGAGLTGGGDLSTDRAVALAAITSGTLLANIAAGTAAPVPTALTALLDAVMGTGRGAVLARGATAWSALALGASGTTLQSNGTDLVFAAASPGAGAVRNDAAQNPTAAQAQQAQSNVGVDGAETDVVSAQTCDIGAVATHGVRITGTAAIASLGTAAKQVRRVRFSGALTLAHDAAKLILPGAANIVTAAGDTCLAASDASGIWRVHRYTRADGSLITGTLAFQVTAANQSDFSTNGAYVLLASVNLVATGKGLDAWGSVYLNHQSTTGSAFFGYVDLLDTVLSSVAATGPVVAVYARSDSNPVVTLATRLAAAGLVPSRTYTLRFFVKRDTIAGPTAINNPTVGGVSL